MIPVVGSVTVLFFRIAVAKSTFVCIEVIDVSSGVNSVLTASAIWAAVAPPPPVDTVIACTGCW